VEGTVTVSRHARNRIRQRFGIPDEHARKLAKDIVKNGHVIAHSPSGSKSYHYKGMVAVLHGSTILTAYPY
jgi:hypothetical protein